MEPRQSYSHVVRDSGRMLHLERMTPASEGFPRAPTGLAVCGRPVLEWNEKAADVWHRNPEQRCSLCEGPLGPRAVLKP